MAFKQGFTGAKGTKVCQENIPTQLNYQQQPKPLIKNRTDSSFHVIYNKSNRLVCDFPQQKSRLRPANVGEATQSAAISDSRFAVLCSCFSAYLR